jgi:soluble P-type ATPase
MAQAIVAEAKRRGLRLSTPSQVKETPGAGLEGRVEGRCVRLGTASYLGSQLNPEHDWLRQVLRRMAIQDRAGVFVAVDGKVAGVLFLADEIRLDTPKALRALHRAGIRRMVMVSGDRQDVAETLAFVLGIDTVLAERSPEEKVAAVLSERAKAVTAMVGDGINDAPALAAADIGVAMGARGAGAASEAADVVLLVDRLDRLAEGLTIACRGRRIALQSVVVGMGMSVLAMLIAAIGYLPPVAGAVLQEGIDVAVILNALRALSPGLNATPTRGLPQQVVQQLRQEHDRLMPLLDRIDDAAAAVSGDDREHARDTLERLGECLREQLLPHEQEDEKTLYPLLAGFLQGTDPLGSMSRTHREIFHLARRYQRLLAGLPDGPLSEFDATEFRRLLYGFGAILRLHFAQEDEIFQAVAG